MELTKEMLLLWLDGGIISSEELEIIKNIEMKGKKGELKKLFRKFGCEEQFKFTPCPSDGRLKLRIPVALREEYPTLRKDYKYKTEYELLTAVYNDLHESNKQKLTLDDVYEMWKPIRIGKLQQKGRTLHTANLNFGAYESLIKGTSFGQKIFKNISYSDFDDFFSKCEGKQITSSMANEIKTCLNFIWDYGQSKKLVNINISREFHLTEYDFIPKKLKPIKNPNEREQLIDYYLSLDSVYGYACALMECLNCRVGEIKAITWDDVFLDDGYIIISHMVNVDNKYREHTKNHDEVGSHFVPLSPRAKSILMKIKEKNYGFKDNFVFLGKNDNYLLTQGCNDTIHDACKKLGIKKNFTTHACRRYAATQAAIKGMSSPALQSSFGWKDRNTAEKYIQVAAAAKEQQDVLINILN